MTGVESAERRLTLKKRIIEYSILAAAIWGPAVVVAQILWWGFQDNIKVELKNILDISPLEAQMEMGFKAMDIKFTDLAIIAQKNSDAILRLTPSPVLVDYSMNGSRVWTPCYPGRVCNYKYRLRRTPFGEKCERPEVLARMLEDHYNTIRIVFPGPEAAVTRASGEWSIYPGSFIVPNDQPGGRARFSMQLRYNCQGDFIETETPPLELTVIEDKP